MVQTRSLIALAIAGTTLFSSCALNPSSNEEEPGRTHETATTPSIGEVAFASIGETASIDALLALSNPAPEGILNSPQIPAPVATSSNGLGKKSLSGEFTIDTIGDELRITTTTETALASKSDTVYVLLNEKTLDNISDNEDVTRLCGSTVFRNGNSEHYMVTDADGDGVLTSGDEMPRAKLTHYTYSAIDNSDKKYHAKATFEASAGADKLFATSNDNLLHCVTWVRFDDNGDTLASAIFTDADGDGSIGSDIAGETDALLVDNYNPLKPLVAAEKVYFRNKRTADGKEQIIRLTAEERKKSGRVNKIWVTDESGDSTLDSGEIAVVHLTSSTPAASDSEATAYVKFTLDPGFSIGYPSDNRLHSISMSRTYRFGIYKTIDFTCDFSPAVPHGQQPEGGTFMLEILYKSGETASLDGSFSGKTIQAVYTGPDADTSTINITDN